MIMRIIRQTQDYLCEFRAQLASDLEEYESGRRSTGVLRNGLRCDDTAGGHRSRSHSAATRKIGMSVRTAYT
jgi:hypothetical protein